VQVTVEIAVGIEDADRRYLDVGEPSLTASLSKQVRRVKDGFFVVLFRCEKRGRMQGAEGHAPQHGRPSLYFQAFN
jgi:hypothetical protein